MGFNQFKGFTLIELLLSMTIMSFIALAIYQNTSQSFILRDRLEQDGDFYNTIRSAIDILTRDIQQMYSPQMAALPEALLVADNTAPPGLAAVPGAQVSGTGTINTEFAQRFWGAPINSVGTRPSRFQGEKTRITFISNSNIRLFVDSKECDLAKVTYTLEDDKTSFPGHKALVRRVDPNVFGDEEKGDTEVRYTLLNNVKSLSFQFLDGEKDSWNNKWDTVSLEHPTKFPSVIELELELDNSTDDTKPRNSIKLKQRFRPEMAI